ncbi:PREDICTED: putative cystathionine gamma-lyase 2 [Nicrophorus vespilloides]|uniref:cystathionine gamma-lyase n=1 Tax=Nicrophorus vespilloides TaxID=110193 RepID=A0ABM1MUI6_NICVS|nr:PREDICTED: putative cystathionine gamma-lyase 2 [Nicrophorus vespilloides]
MSRDFQSSPKGFSTKAIHAGYNPDNSDSMCVVPPIVMSTTYKQDRPGEFKKYEYGRSGNPSRDVLESCLASLEGAKHGICFSSGLGAITGLLGMFQSGDHLITGMDLYGGSKRVFSQISTRFGMEVSHVDCTDIRNIKDAIKVNTKLIWLETPTNPTLKVIDIRAVAALSKEKNIILAVDNTFLTPYFQRPLELGADLSTYSLTKYMNGHTDVIMGAILTNNQQYHEKLRFLQNAMGIIPSPFDCSLVNRSLKTLALRMRQHSENGIQVAKFLETHPKVKQVMHPGLASHPQHDLFKSQTSGHSGMVAFYLKGELKESMKFLDSLKIFTLAPSLGGCESLADLPCKMTAANVPVAQQKILNINDSLIRLTVGLEDIEDLIHDLKQALDSI